jgi:hypothetical protein
VATTWTDRAIVYRQLRAEGYFRPREAAMDTATRTAVLVFVVASLAGCSAFKDTYAQNLALERWQTCQGTVPDATLKEIKFDGQIVFLYSSPTGLTNMNDCLREAAVTQRQRATTSGVNVTVVQPPSPVGVPAPTPATGGSVR